MPAGAGIALLRKLEVLVGEQELVPWIGLVCHGFRDCPVAFRKNLAKADAAENLAAVVAGKEGWVVYEVGRTP